MEATLLVELLTEELPPKSLKELAGVFSWKLYAELQKDRLLADGSSASAFATPRRLAVLIAKVKERSPDAEREVQGPPVSAAAQAVSGFAKKNGVAVEALKKQQTAKGEVYIAHVTVRGQALAETLAAKVEAALKDLPIPKVMRWGSGDAQFVRPVHGLVMLHGKHLVPGRVLGLESRNQTQGHRFLGVGRIVLSSADEYETQLRDEGMVVADFDKRKSEIERQLQSGAKKENASLGEYQPLLDEVTALVEHPSVYVGEFEKMFLEIPQECLILTMRQNQKYFPLFDAAGKLLPKFLIVSNMQVADPRYIIGGNQRVVRPRLEDARFFFNQDRKQRLEDRVPLLAKVVYHNKLGSQLDRVQRIRQLAGRIARLLAADTLKTERAAELSKADLLTGMVGEFPELQGTMGRYYALHDEESTEVANAIEGHYLPRFAGDELAEGSVACSVALADKLISLAGMFGIQQEPSGDKDPFGLRRAALGLVRTLVERDLPLSLNTLIANAFEVFTIKLVPANLLVEEFIYERFSSYLRDLGFSTIEIDSVLSTRPQRLDQVPRKLAAVRTFLALPEAQSLAAANKRIRNILSKSKPPSGDIFSEEALKEDAEIALHNAFRSIDFAAALHLNDERYSEALTSLAALKGPVDAFFDKVMVNVEDQRLRNNRLHLLMQLDSAMNRVADISRLAA